MSGTDTYVAQTIRASASVALGFDIERLETLVAAVDKRILDVDQRLADQLAAHAAAPVEDTAWSRPIASIFLCAHLPVSAAFLEYITDLRAAVRDHFKDLPDSLSFSDPKTQHCTIFVIHRSDSVPEKHVLEDWRKLIEPLIEVPTFTLYFSRPLVTPEGGLILKGECFSDSLFSIRRRFRDDGDAETAIIHSTFGHVRSTDYGGLAGLREKLLNLDAKEFSVRVRDLRVAMSLGGDIVDWGKALALTGNSAPLGIDATRANVLDNCTAVAARGTIGRALRYIIREQALDQLENPAGPLSQLAAERLVRATKGSELCGY
jgi:hypothetical protein